jgi:hypothetical protein
LRGDVLVDWTRLFNVALAAIAGCEVAGDGRALASVVENEGDKPSCDRAERECKLDNRFPLDEEIDGVPPERSWDMPD